MKTKLFVAVLASAAIIVQVKAGGARGGGGGARGGAVAHPSAVAHAGAVACAPMRPGGISSFHPMPARGFGGGMNYPRQRYSFGMRSYRPNQFGQSSIYRNRVTFTRSGPYTAATIR